MANFIVVFSPSVLSLESFLACVGKCAVSATSEIVTFCADRTRGTLHDSGHLHAYAKSR